MIAHHPADNALTVPTVPDFSFSVSGGYANTQDVTTYVASRLDARALAPRVTAGSRRT